MSKKKTLKIKRKKEAKKLRKKVENNFSKVVSQLAALSIGKGWGIAVTSTDGVEIDTIMIGKNNEVKRFSTDIEKHISEGSSIEEKVLKEVGLYAEAVVAEEARKKGWDMGVKVDDKEEVIGMVIGVPNYVRFVARATKEKEDREKLEGEDKELSSEKPTHTETPADEEMTEAIESQ